MNNDTQGRKRRIFTTIAVLALMAGVAVGYSDATTGKLYNALAQKPGAGNGPVAACIRVTYSGSLASSMKLYRGAVTNGDKFRLTVERGGTSLTAPAADMNCTNFGATSTAFDNTLDQFPTTYAGGIDGKALGAAWSSGQSVDYRFTIYPVDDSTPNAHTTAVDTGTHSFTWEAQNN